MQWGKNVIGDPESAFSKASKQRRRGVLEGGKDKRCIHKCSQPLPNNMEGASGSLAPAAPLSLRWTVTALQHLEQDFVRGISRQRSEALSQRSLFGSVLEGGASSCRRTSPSSSNSVIVVVLEGTSSLGSRTSSLSSTLLAHHCPRRSRQPR